MSRSENAIVTALCMIYKDNLLLLQDRVKEDWQGITFPGGHIEKEESFVQGIKREMLEETGLVIHNPKICGVKQFQTENDERYIVLLFKTNEFEGEVVSSDEGEMLWIEREKLSEYNIVDDFMDLLRVFDDENINEIMYERHRCNGDWDWIMKLY
ncbi:MAG: NUDIX domain-containing protein [Eubacteriales bacterium]|nr:NUDIX domain-containing protein [Eubacteriales bacterium]